MVRQNVSAQANPEKTGYIVTDATLAVLARDYAASVERAGRVRGTYLSVLVAHSKRELKARRPSIEQALEAIERVSEHFYAVILDAVVTPEIAITDGLSDEEKIRRSKERTRRATFARTAKSTLTSAVRAGAKLAAMDPAKVTKASLQQYYAHPREGPGTIPERIQRAEERLEDLLKKLMQEDPTETERLVGEIQQRLDSILEGSESQPVHQMKGRRRVGELTLHPH